MLRKLQEEVKLKELLTLKQLISSTNNDRPQNDLIFEIYLTLDYELVFTIFKLNSFYRYKIYELI
jgi:hypothetical protein